MPYRIWGRPADQAEVCDVCGALVAKPKRHRKWHKRMEQQS